MKDYNDYDNNRDETTMSYYEREQYDRQCRTIGESNMMPLFTGTDIADLFSGSEGLF